MNTIQNFHGIALKQNVDKTVHQLKVTLAAGLLVTLACNEFVFVKVESCYQFCPYARDDSFCILEGFRYGENEPQIIMFSLMFFKWNYHLLLLILMMEIVVFILKIFKFAIM